MNGSKFLAKRFKNKEETTFKSIDESEKNQIINLGIGDLGIHTDKIIINSAFQDALNGHTHYTDPLGDLDLRKEIIEYHKTQFNNYNVDLNEVIVYSASAISQRAALAALKNREHIKNSIVPLYKERVEYSLNRINNITGLRAFAPQGGIYIFIDISETNLNSIQYSDYLLKN